MTFLHPILFAAGFASIAIPIVIHFLLRQRRKPIMWGAMRFLMEAYRRQRQRLQLEQIILLITRCLLLALLAAAIARPLLQSAGILAGPSGRVVYVLLDTGLASSVLGNDPRNPSTALDRHKQSAASVLAGLGPADRAGLVLLGAPAQPVVTPASSDIAAVRRLIEEATPTDGATDLAGAFELVASAIGATEQDRTAPTTVLILSDFLLGSADTSRALPDPLASLQNVSILASTPRSPADAPDNVQIIALDPLRPVVLTGTRGADASADREQVRLQLRRTGPAIASTAVTTVRLQTASSRAGEAPRAPASQGIVRWSAGQSEASLSLQVSTAGERGEAGVAILAEIDRDAIPGDNLFRRPISVRESLRVGVLDRPRFGAGLTIDRLAPSDWLRLALRPTPGTPIDLVDIDPSSIDSAALAGVDALCCPAPDLLRDDDWKRLRRFVDAGGLLFITPSADASVHLWTDAMTRELGLEWRLAREPRAYAEPMTIDEQSAAGGSLLNLIAPEIPSLARPVGVRRVVALDSTARSTEVLLALKDGTPWLVADEPNDSTISEAAPSNAPAQAGRGLVVYLASAPALEWTDLPAKPLMVPLMQEISRQGFSRAAGSFVSIAGQPIIAPARTTELRPADGAEADPLALSAQGAPASPLRHAGLWEAVDDAGRRRAVIGVNADADAGRVATQDQAAVRAWLATAMGDAGTDQRFNWLDEQAASAALAPVQAESPLSLPLLMAALLLAFAELIMARYFSHAFAS